MSPAGDVDAHLRQIWDRIAAAIAAEAVPDPVPPHPPTTLADIEKSLQRWSRREPGCARTVALNALLDRKLRLQKDR